jgi:hypothetical protein
VERRTKLLLDDLEDFLLVKLLGKTLNSGQSLTTIALCNKRSAVSSTCGFRLRGVVLKRFVCRAEQRERTNAGYECECNSGIALSLPYPRRLRRRDLCCR